MKVESTILPRVLSESFRGELAQKFYANVLDRDRSKHDWILDD